VIVNKKSKGKNKASNKPRPTTRTQVGYDRGLAGPPYKKPTFGSIDDRQLLLNNNNNNNNLPIVGFNYHQSR